MIKSKKLDSEYKAVKKNEVGNVKITKILSQAILLENFSSINKNQTNKSNKKLKLLTSKPAVMAWMFKTLKILINVGKIGKKACIKAVLL